jgi:Sugar transferases involved in lipopolysaccharide synthesis
MIQYRVVKRILDIILALVLLVVAFPLMVVTAIAIKLDTKGPILFKQRRPGQGNEIFTVYKFRTMIVETEKDQIKLSDMNRMTKIGAFLRKASIDELPQLFNIVRGEMSFIGPRPLLVQYIELYTHEQARRHDVKPGISGWAQVNGRNAISWEEKFRLDVWYVDHISLKLDIKIVGMTILNVLRRKDINISRKDTMPFFVGSKQSKNESQ